LCLRREMKLIFRRAAHRDFADRLHASVWKRAPWRGRSEAISCGEDHAGLVILAHYPDDAVARRMAAGISSRSIPPPRHPRRPGDLVPALRAGLARLHRGAGAQKHASNAGGSAMCCLALSIRTRRYAAFGRIPCAQLVQKLAHRFHPPARCPTRSRPVPPFPRVLAESVCASKGFSVLLRDVTGIISRPRGIDIRRRLVCE